MWTYVCACVCVCTLQIFVTVNWKFSLFVLFLCPSLSFSSSLFFISTLFLLSCWLCTGNTKAFQSDVFCETHLDQTIRFTGGGGQKAHCVIKIKFCAAKLIFRYAWGLKPTKDLFHNPFSSPSIISSVQKDLKRLFPIRRLSVAVPLWPHCPLLSLNSKNCRDHTEDRTRPRDTFKRGHSMHWPVHTHQKFPKSICSAPQHIQKSASRQTHTCIPLTFTIATTPEVLTPCRQACLQSDFVPFTLC